MLEDLKLFSVQTLSSRLTKACISCGSRRFILLVMLVCSTFCLFVWRKKWQLLQLFNLSNVLLSSGFWFTTLLMELGVWMCLFPPLANAYFEQELLEISFSLLSPETSVIREVCRADYCCCKPWFKGSLDIISGILQSICICGNFD